MSLSKKILSLSALALSFFMSGCFEYTDSCRKQGGFLVCSATQQATICSPHGGESFKCVTKEECGSYTCDMTNSTEVYFVGVRQISANKSQFTLADFAYDKLVEKVVNADLDFAQRVGIDLKDLENLSKGRAMSSQSLLRISNNTNETPESLNKVFNHLSQRLEIERTNSDSFYWKSCMASGSWITNMNVKCEQAHWNGCSPESGAQFCLTDLGAKRLKLRN